MRVSRGESAMKNVSLAEAKANIEDVLRTVEGGEAVTIQPIESIADQASLTEEQRQERSRQAIEAIMEVRKTAPRVTTEEILEWIREGRR